MTRANSSTSSRDGASTSSAAGKSASRHDTGAAGKIPQTLGLTARRLVDTVEMLRRMAHAGEFDQAGRHAAYEDVLYEALATRLDQIHVTPGEVLLACEILAYELPPTHAAQKLLLEVVFRLCRDQREERPLSGD
jgi:hypothetical protein